MTKVEVSILGRTAADGAFAKRWSTTVEVPAGVTVKVSPEGVQAGSDVEKVVEVRAEGGSVNFAFFDPRPVEADDRDPPWSLRGKVFSGAMRQTRRTPFSGGIIGLCRIGAPQPSA